jgi:phosphomannomutase/phosphoglucomutase
MRTLTEKGALPEGKGLSVIVDCANGTGGAFSPEILRKIGCQVSTLNAQPDGRFPGRLPEPTKENLSSLMTTVKSDGAHLGIAHDGDSDRAIFVDEKGDYVSGDKSLALFAIDALKRTKGAVVTAVNTSKIVSDVVEANGGKIELAPIGSPFIARYMRDVNAVFGGEGNGGVIFPEHQYSRDGMMTAVKMIRILVDGGKPLSELVGSLPEYHLAREKIPIPRDFPKETLMETVIKEAEGEVITIDGLKMISDDHWVLIRFSGTESALRVTAESDSASKTSGLLSEHKNKVEELIASLSS